MQAAAKELAAMGTYSADRLGFLTQKKSKKASKKSSKKDKKPSKKDKKPSKKSSKKDKKDSKKDSKKDEKPAKVKHVPVIDKKEAEKTMDGLRKGIKSLAEAKIQEKKDM